MAGTYTFEIATDTPKKMREFIDFPKRLYRDCEQWVPQFDLDMRGLLKKTHPFFLHSEGDFLLLKKDGETVARSLIVGNTRYNAHHGTNFAFFDFFDCINDLKTAETLFAHLMDWANSRGFEGLCGPMLSGGSYGAGVLIKGFDHYPAMTMMKYNYPYYQELFEACGFEKYVDLNSFSIPPDQLVLPERIRKMAEHVLKRGRFKVLNFKNKRQLRKVADDVKDLYGKTLNHHLEDYPMTQEELDQVEKDLFTILDPDLVTILAYDEKVIGFAFAFADISPILHRNGGRLNPLSILRMFTGMKKARRVLFNGIGILPEYQRLGGNALVYYEMEKLVKKREFLQAEMVQISEETKLMLSDAHSLGGESLKIHRLYQKR